MPENLQPETMSTWMRDVERRLRAVESRSVPIGMPLIPRFGFTPQIITSSTPTLEFLLGIPYTGRFGVHVGMLLNIEGSAEITLTAQSEQPIETDSSTFLFTGTAVGLLSFNWDLTGVAAIGDFLSIAVYASVATGGHSVTVSPPWGYEADPAFINATDDGNPVFA
jgi:hypothetical protein